MKTYSLAAAALVLMSSAAFAAPGYSNHRSHQGGGLSQYERVAIARSQAHLNALKRQAWADGRLSFFERMRIRSAEYQHNRLVARARQS